jgi:hypothetical protein
MTNVSAFFVSVKKPVTRERAHKVPRREMRVSQTHPEKEIVTISENKNGAVCPVCHIFQIAPPRAQSGQEVVERCESHHRPLRWVKRPTGGYVVTPA